MLRAASFPLRWPKPPDSSLWPWAACLFTTVDPANLFCVFCRNTALSQAFLSGAAYPVLSSFWKTPIISCKAQLQHPPSLWNLSHMTCSRQSKSPLLQSSTAPWASSLHYAQLSYLPSWLTQLCFHYTPPRLRVSLRQFWVRCQIRLYNESVPRV